MYLTPNYLFVLKDADVINHRNMFSEVLCKKEYDIVFMKEYEEKYGVSF